MDNMMMDPEFSSEMVKLLAQELKVVRAQLREAERRASTPHSGGHSNGLTLERAQALIAENDTLKSDNAALQERMTRLQDELIQSSSIKLEEGLPNPLQCAELTSHMSGELARLLAENEDLIRGKEEASRNQAKLSVLLEKYRHAKAKAHEYNEMLGDLSVALSNCTEELGQARKALVTEIDIRDPLKDLAYEPVEGQLQFSSIQPYARVVHTKLYKDAVGVCEGPCFINCNEVIWSPSGIALGLVVKPTFQYNPKLKGGTWSKLEDSFHVGKQLDLCCLSGKTARYLGTYERVADQGTTVIASETLKYLDREKLEYASDRTTLFPDLVPPSQTQMIKNMYKQGVIKLQCFVIRRVAVNQTFAEKLRDTCASSVPRNPSDDTVIPTSAINSEGIRKRKRDPKSTVHRKRNKKRKH